MSYKHLFIKNYSKEEMIRVNHAGELGAKGIYCGQLSVLRDQCILEMLESELEHLDFFEDLIKKGGGAPTIMLPIWTKMSYLLGFISARCGRDYAMLCTQAVEEIIERHYSDQMLILPDEDLRKKIDKFRDDELEHRDIATGECRDLDCRKKIFYQLVRTATSIAIKISYFW